MSSSLSYSPIRFGAQFGSWSGRRLGFFCVATITVSTDSSGGGYFIQCYDRGGGVGPAGSLQRRTSVVPRVDVWSPAPVVNGARDCYCSREAGAVTGGSCGVTLREVAAIVAVAGVRRRRSGIRRAYPTGPHRPSSFLVYHGSVGFRSIHFRWRWMLQCINRSWKSTDWDTIPQWRRRRIGSSHHPRRRPSYWYSYSY